MKIPRSIPALLGAIAWGAASLVGWGSLLSAGAASPAPVVHVNTQIAEIGQFIYFTGAGWSPVGQTVQIELCGQDARDLSNDCDQANQYTAAIRTGGTFFGGLRTHLPPSPCPCVLLVTNQSGSLAVQVPITIPGAPTAAVPPPAAPKPPVALSAKVMTPVSVSAWFGGPKAVTLVIRVTNVSSIAYAVPTLTVFVGKGSNPSGFVVGRPLAPLAIGATQVLRIPVTLPAFTFGHYSVRARLITGQGDVATLVGTDSYPWGLFVVGVIVILGAGLVVTVRLRRRATRQRLPGPGNEQREMTETAPSEVART